MVDKMEIEKLIAVAHSNAVEKGFYPEGVEKNIGELLMLIVSELGEALEAHRKNRFADWTGYQNHLDYYDSWDKKSPGYLSQIPISFRRNIKDTFEDEIADVYIRLFDLCGYLHINPHLKPYLSTEKLSDNVGERLLYLCGILCEMHIDPDKGLTQGDYISIVISMLNLYCTTWKIPIRKHITAKMEYNKTRPHKHGKAY